MDNIVVISPTDESVYPHKMLGDALLAPFNNEALPASMEDISIYLEIKKKIASSNLGYVFTSKELQLIVRAFKSYTQWSFTSAEIIEFVHQKTTTALNEWKEKNV